MARAQSAAERADEQKPTTDPVQQNQPGLCRICNIPRCSNACPKVRRTRVKRAVTRLLLAAALVHLDATADHPAIAYRDLSVVHEREVPRICRSVYGHTRIIIGAWNRARCIRIDLTRPEIDLRLIR